MTCSSEWLFPLLDIIQPGPFIPPKPGVPESYWASARCLLESPSCFGSVGKASAECLNHSANNSTSKSDKYMWIKKIYIYIYIYSIYTDYSITATFRVGWQKINLFLQVGIGKNDWQVAILRWRPSCGLSKNAFHLQLLSLFNMALVSVKHK